MPVFLVATLLVVLGALSPSAAYSEKRPRAVTSSRFCIGKPDGFYTDPRNCDKLFKCESWKTTVDRCPEGMVYNPYLGVCDCNDDDECSTKTEKIEAEKTQPMPVNETCKYRVCYFNQIGAAKRFPRDVDASLCTHLVFASATLKNNMIKALGRYDESTPGRMGKYEKAVRLKARYPSLKVLLSIGGWYVTSSPFTTMVATKENRTEFIKTSISFLRRIGFDGLDIDWQYPGNRRGNPNDKARYSDLLRELRAAFIQEAAETYRPRLLLTAKVSAGKTTIDPAYEIPVLNSQLDFINLMAYSFRGAWQGNVGHNSPMYPWRDDEGWYRTLNVDWAAKYWVQKGASKDKLVIGVPLYGRTFTLESSTNSGIGAPTKGPGNPGKYTRRKGFLAYYEICELLNSGFESSFLEDQRVPYLVKGDQWIGYDDETSLKEKVRYIRENGYAGVMMWDTSYDDFGGTYCGKGPFPLMHAVVEQCNA